MQTSIKNNRYRLKPHEVAALQKMRESEARNVLVIGDLHEPFCLDGYLDWCLEQYEDLGRVEEQIKSLDD